jgi:hypothetical protein
MRKGRRGRSQRRMGAAALRVEARGVTSRIMLTLNPRERKGSACLGVRKVVVLHISTNFRRFRLEAVGGNVLMLQGP